MFQISRYQLEERIGSGSMGGVYRALDRLTGQHVALKLVGKFMREDEFQTPINNTEEHRFALAQEFRTLSSLHHPFIISVLDYGFSRERQPYFTMEYLPDGKDFIRAARSQPFEIQVGLLCQVLQALAYLHRSGILHRDLKPNNILVQDGRARVLDFGLSVAINAARGSAGTLAYMAPEVLQMGIADTASDLYSIGVIAYQLFSGQLPFANNDVSGILTRPPDLSRINGSRALADFIGNLLEKDPAERCADAGLALSRLTEAVGMPAPNEDEAIRESYLRSARFVGREREIENLSSALHDARTGHGSVWLVDGESGVGKTRLFDELRTHALVSGATVVRGQAVAGSGSPYQIWQEPLRQLALVTSLSNLQVGVLAQFIPNLANLLNLELPPLHILDVAAAHQRLVLTIADVIQSAAQANPPLVLILEDLHWATEDLEPLKVLSRVAGTSPLMIVANYRSDESVVITDEMPGIHCMSLSRLGVGQIRQLSEFILGASGTRPEVVEWLVRETEGNVFFLVETLRALAEEAGKLEEIGKRELPNSLLTQGMQQVLQRRIERIPPSGRTLLDLAAIAGRVLDLRLLSDLTDQDLDYWLITGANVAVFDQQDGVWQFAHDKLRETLLYALEPSSRQLLYRHVAEACERVYPNDVTHAGLLSTWWRGANEPQKESWYARQAGEYAVLQQSYVQAESFISRALELCSSDAFPERCELLIRLADIHIEMERNTELDTDLQKLESLTDHLTPAQLLKVQLLRARYEYLFQNYSKALGILGSVVHLAEELQDEEGLTGIERLWGTILMQQAAYEDALQHFERVLVLCRKNGNQRDEASILSRMAAIYYDRGDPENVELSTRALELYRAAGDKNGEGRELTNQGNALDEQGEREQALDRYSKALQLFGQTGYQYGEAIVLVNMGFLYERLGDYEEAFRNDLRSLEIFRKAGSRELEIGALTNLASVRYNQRNYPEARDYAYQAVQLGEVLGGNRLDVPARVLLGNAHIALKELQEAQQNFDAALKICEQTGYKRIMADLWNGLARLALERMEQDQALEAIEQILLLCATDPSLTSMSDEPMRVFSTCHVILQLHNDPRAAAILENAHTQLKSYAAKLTDPNLRHMFLEQVPANREIISLWHRYNLQNLALGGSE